MRKLIPILLALLLPVPAQADVLDEGAFQGAKSVPLMEQWRQYENRNPVVFQVCGDIPVRQAARLWNQALPRQMFTTHSVDCEGSQGNGINEIFSKRINRKVGRNDVVGYYAGTPNGEEDIVIDAVSIRERSDTPHASLVNLIVHELGHALGLGDAYDKYPHDCGWSVMLSVCSSQIIPPQPADLDALKQVLNWPTRTLEDFDTNGNGLLDDTEFFEVIDAWVGGSVTDSLFFEAMDAWVQGTRISGESLELKDALEIAIYNLNGTRIDVIPGHLLSVWQHHASNGVYIYRARLPNGIRTGKMVVKL